MEGKLLLFLMEHFFIFNESLFLSYSECGLFGVTLLLCLQVL